MSDARIDRGFWATGFDITEDAQGFLVGGECAHCGTHVTSGEFDWVLSKIEQDEAYRG